MRPIAATALAVAVLMTACSESAPVPEVSEGVAEAPQGDWADFAAAPVLAMDRDDPGCELIDPAAPARTVVGAGLLTETCVIVGESPLDLSHVAAAEVTEDDVGFYVDVTLTPEGAERFDALAAENVGERVALVAAGRAWSAPTIEADRFGGALQIGRLSEPDARHLAEFLSPS